MKPFLFLAVVQNHIKTARHRNDKLMQILVCVPAAFSSAGNIVKIVNALDLKRYMSPTLNEREIPSWIADFGEVNNPAFA